MARAVEWIDLGMFKEMEPDEWVSSVNAARLLGYDGAHSNRVFRMLLGKNLHGHDTGGWSHSRSKEFARRNFGRIEGRELLEDGTWRDLDAPWGMTLAGFNYLAMDAGTPEAMRIREGFAVRLAEANA